MSEEAGAWNDTSGSRVSCTPPRTNKENEMFLSKMNNAARGRKDVVPTATLVAGSTNGGPDAGADDALSSFFLDPGGGGPHRADAGRHAGRAWGRFDSAVDMTSFDETVNDEFFSMGETALARRRRRRDQFGLDNSTAGEKQSHDLEQALQSLEKMQRENKERMLRVSLQTPSTNSRPPSERASGRSGHHLLQFFRTQSVGGLPLSEPPQCSKFKRVMTSSVMPEPNMTTPKPLPLQQKQAGLPGFYHRSPPPRPHGVSQVPKDNETHQLVSRGSFSALFSRVESRARMPTSPRATVGGQQPAPTVDKMSLPPGGHASAQPRTVVGNQKYGNVGGDSQGVGRPDGGKRTNISRGRYERLQSEVNAEGTWCQPTRSDEGKGANGAANGTQHVENGKKPVSRRSGRSTSPRIIILTVDSRRNMGEEDARRLLSAEPVRGYDPHTRRMLHSAEGYTSSNNPSKKHSPDTKKARSPNAKEKPATGATATEALSLSSPIKVLPPSNLNIVSTTTKETPVMEAKKVRVPVSTKSPRRGSLSAAAAPGPGRTSPPRQPTSPRPPAVTAADRRKVEDRGEPPKLSGASSTGQVPPKSRNATGTPPPQSSSSTPLPPKDAVANHASLPAEKSVASVTASKQRTSKNTNGSSKAAVASSGEQKTKTQIQTQSAYRSATFLRTPTATASASVTTTATSTAPAPTAAAGKTVTAATRRRVSSGVGRTVHSRREEAGFLHEKDACNNRKSASPRRPLDTNYSSPLKQPQPQQLLWRRKSLSALTHGPSIERDPYRPLATDRPAVSRVKAVKRGTIVEMQTSQQLVPFCTECGKRHLGNKVKFCAFCGHKRECVK